MAEIFRHDLKVLFQHCDPAGIVFYPRYFEMVNQTVEEWHAQSLGYSFAQMHEAGEFRGVPTVTITADFPAPSRIGDMLTWSLYLTKLGRTSAHLNVTARHGDEPRVVARPVLVCIDTRTGRPNAWDETVRDRMARFVHDVPPA
ncbi:thioesterase family protein [Sulfitobacter sp. D35]|uniref:acyl-CoA thioesterase n=1 Tax=Sulfitobacter sp. D35 TaxID=3083252 RepID=UPI00296E6610|nr:thioesterase family protein [Sulfitobacter sp. D35]MDW4498886.1 thioesterase family protein [Sulfitobacter sp. D35]